MTSTQIFFLAIQKYLREILKRGGRKMWVVNLKISNTIEL